MSLCASVHLTKARQVAPRLATWAGLNWERQSPDWQAWATLRAVVPVRRLAFPVRRDYEREEQRKWRLLRNELKSGATADESAFVPLDANAIISQAKARKKVSGK